MHAHPHINFHQVEFGCRPSRFGEIKTVLLVGPTEVCVCERERESDLRGDGESAVGGSNEVFVCVCVRVCV